MGIFKEIGKFFTGSPSKRENVSALMKSQQPLYDQLQAANMGKGAGGSFGESADYYRDLLDPNSQTAQQMFAPEMRQFNEEIIPGLSEQFAGMGSGGLSSSGFRNAAVNAGTDLSERLGAIRAQLRQQGAAGLSNLGQQGLQSYSQPTETQQGSSGFLSQIAPLAGTAIGAFGGPVGAAAGGAIGNWISNSFGGSNVGKNSSPYGSR